MEYYKLPFPAEDLDKSEVELDFTTNQGERLSPCGHLSVMEDPKCELGRIIVRHILKINPRVWKETFVILTEEQANQLQCIQERQGTEVLPRFRLVS